VNNSIKPNLLLSVASISMIVCRRHLADYSRPKSKHTFTQTQLMSCLILRAYLKTTYRGIVEVLDASDKLRALLGLDLKLPDHSTLKKFADRIASPDLIDALIGQVLKLCLESPTPVAAEQVAGDSTGVETTGASAHFVARSGRSRHRYVKLSVAVTCTSMLAVAVLVSWGPRTDKCEGMELTRRCAGRVTPRQVFFDAGYDSDPLHAFCHQTWGVSSYIPPVVHRKDGTLGGTYRPLMNRPPDNYGLRWHVESFFSGLKRVTGSTLAARSEPALFTEAALRVLAYAIRR
jgi:hypothetical protein